MVVKQPHQVVITDAAGTATVERRLYERLAAKMHPDELGLLHRYDWWAQMSEALAGIRLAGPATSEGRPA